jgi:hypothetical protein
MIFMNYTMLAFSFLSGTFPILYFVFALCVRKNEIQVKTEAPLFAANYSSTPDLRTELKNQ